MWRNYQISLLNTLVLLALSLFYLMLMLVTPSVSAVETYKYEGNFDLCRQASASDKSGRPDHFQYNNDQVIYCKVDLDLLENICPMSFTFFGIKYESNEATYPHTVTVEMVDPDAWDEETNLDLEALISFEVTVKETAGLVTFDIPPSIYAYWRVERGFKNFSFRFARYISELGKATLFAEPGKEPWFEFQYHLCHANAQLLSNYDEFACKCVDGFVGDGIESCVDRCPESQLNNAVFPETPLDTKANGECLPGYVKTTGGKYVYRTCKADGKWENQTTGSSCVPEELSCPAGYVSNTYFQETPVGSDVIGECNAPLYGYNGDPPKAMCQISSNGKFGEWVNLINDCILIPCIEETVGNVFFNETVPPFTVVGLCLPGHHSDQLIERTCHAGGEWGEPYGDCEPMFCAQEDVGNVSFEQAQAGKTILGVCHPNFETSQPIERTCTIEAKWLPPTGDCTGLEIRCEVTILSNSIFQEAEVGTIGTGKCVDGHIFGPNDDPRAECENINGEGKWINLANDCIPIPCNGERISNSILPSAVVGDEVQGQCASGFKFGSNGPPKAKCVESNGVGKWDNLVNDCEAIYCEEKQMGTVQFGKTKAGQTETGTCISGYESNDAIQAECDLNGDWSSPSGSCTPIYCDGKQMENAQFGKTQAGQTAIGTCISGYESSNTIQAECDLNGDWSSPSSSCTPIYCEGKQMENAQFGKTQAGTTGTGTCLPGYGYEYSYTIQTECDISGNWLAPLNSCSWITCPPVSYQVADFSVTNGGNNATGTCHDGYMSEGDGPVRYCLPNGKWSNDVYHPCIGYCETEDGFNATWPLAFVGMTSIGECSVDFFGAPERLCVEMAPGKYAFEDTITGTLCFEMSCPADGEWPEIGVGNRVNKKCDTYYTGVRYRDCERPDNITATEGVWSTLGTTCTIIKCAQSVTDEYFLQETNVTEEAVGKCLDGLIGTPTAKCILDKDGESASFGEISNVCRATSAEGMLALPIIVGVAAGLVALILCLFFLLVFLYRRRRKGKEEEHGDMYEMFAKKATQDSMSMSGTLNRSNGNLSTGPVDTTLINTVTEIVLPGFLKLNFATDVRQGEKIGAGGAGSLYMGVGLNPHVFPKKSNKENIAIKRFHDLEYGMKNEMAVNSFFQEVSIMWSLNSHPNVIRLLGYSESPYAIVMELHATDLRTLIHQENVLTHELAFMLATDIISAIAAMHVKGITHRDIKTSNVLIDQRDRLTAILCDFGLARVADTSITILSSKFVTVEGLSPRYTPPEVVRRFVNKNLNEPYPSIEVEKQSDIFSYGIVVWEMLTKVIPWTQNPGVAETKQIFDALLRGERPLPDIEDFANNYPSNSPLKFLSVIIKFCLAQDPDKRPTATDIFHKLKKS